MEAGAYGANLAERTSANCYHCPISGLPTVFMTLSRLHGFSMGTRVWHRGMAAK
jgi:hypothetical protein